MTDDYILDWEGQLRDNRFLFLKSQIETVVRMPADIGRVVGNERVARIARSIFSGKELWDCLYDCSWRFDICAGVPIYEVILPPSPMHANMHGPDEFDFFAQKVFDAYYKLKKI